MRQHSQAATSPDSALPMSAQASRTQPAPASQPPPPPSDAAGTDAASVAADDQDLLEFHAAQHAPIANCPLVPGNAVRLIHGGMESLRAIWSAISEARDTVRMAYYILQDVEVDGTALSALLHRKLREGVRVAVIYDGFGSNATPDALFDGLAAAGAQVLEYRSLNPLRRHFSPRWNDRDHRKILVVDGRVAFLGGVNLDRCYLNPRAAGTPADGDTEHAFWRDCTLRIDGPAVAEVQKLFEHRWKQQESGVPLQGNAFPPLAAEGGEVIRVDGSAPGERRPLYSISIRTALRSARRSFFLATGYFVPQRREWQLLAAAAERGVRVRLLLPGFSDLAAAIHAARALYGRLLRHGVEIREIRQGVLHMKAAAADGAWSAVGSSNFDRRSVLYNDEIDAIVLGRDTAAAVEAMLEQEWAEAEPVTLQGWEGRSLREKALEHLARGWERYM